MNEANYIEQSGAGVIPAVPAEAANHLKPTHELLEGSRVENQTPDITATGDIAPQQSKRGGDVVINPQTNPEKHGFVQTFKDGVREIMISVFGPTNPVFQNEAHDTSIYKDLHDDGKHQVPPTQHISLTPISQQSAEAQPIVSNQPSSPEVPTQTPTAIPSEQLPSNVIPLNSVPQPAQPSEQGVLPHAA